MCEYKEYKGTKIFGKAYDIMYQNDTHVQDSVDRVLVENMVKLNKNTVNFLYSDFTNTISEYRTGTRSKLEKIVNDLIVKSKTLDNIVNYCRNIVENCNIRSEDMVFGGTEEEIIERGTYWCTDIARVACVMLQIAGYPSRILITANTNFAYCGHSVVETFYKNKWGVVDPTNGIIITFPDGTPANAWDIQNDANITNTSFYEKYPDWKDFFTPGEQYESVGIANYYIMNNLSYNYEASRLNKYTAGILTQSKEKWKDGLRWIYGEDREIGFSPSSTTLIRQGTSNEMLTLWYKKHTSEFFIDKINKGDAEFWTIENENNLIGELYLFKKLNESDFADGKTTAYLCAFRIIEELQGKGYGTMLMNRVFERIQELGFRYVTIGVEESESANTRLYYRMGFTEKIRFCYDDPCDVNEFFEPNKCIEYILLRKTF